MDKKGGEQTKGKQGAIENRMSQIFGKGWEQRGIGAKMGQKLERVNRWIIGSHVKNTTENSWNGKNKVLITNHGAMNGMKFDKFCRSLVATHANFRQLWGESFYMDSIEVKSPSNFEPRVACWPIWHGGAAGFSQRPKFVLQNKMNGPLFWKQICPMSPILLSTGAS